MAYHRHHGEGEHHQRNVTVPAMPGSALVVIETKLVLRRLKAVLDRPPMAFDRHQRFDRRSRWAPGGEEGEETVCELSEHFAFGKLDLSDISGISYKHDGKIVRNGRRPAVANLDAIPFPSRDTIRASLERRSAVHVLSSRGCAAHCTFCSIVAFEGIGWFALEAAFDRKLRGRVGAG